MDHRRKSSPTMGGDGKGEIIMKALSLMRKLKNSPPKAHSGVRRGGKKDGRVRPRPQGGGNGCDSYKIPAPAMDRCKVVHHARNHVAAHGCIMGITADWAGRFGPYVYCLILLLFTSCFERLDRIGHRRPRACWRLPRGPGPPIVPWIGHKALIHPPNGLGSHKSARLPGPLNSVRGLMEPPHTVSH